ncbi:intermembrane phospholipid transport protein YdbH family protein [Brevundimonas sp.]|uniref:intermembrane phospholipid transport protein YdbH family protein n=1 Tax=Brevundimonas sp. TaxID=1871086 RepID=UPI002C28A549|nr:YdbH domain-containing protein [Brevundimonas sp.]HWQ86960.1 YdbH domain-containing protein [Brevundimonas sp.]
MSAASPTPVPRRPRGRPVLIVAGAVLGVLLVVAALLYLNRRAATRQVLIGWLEQQGVDADMQIERLEMDGLVARIRIGDPADPDVTVERVEVDYGIGAPWSKGGLGVIPTRIRLVRPVVRASVRGGKLTFGSLDPLVERFTGRPPRPDSRSPLVIVERARVRLDTDYGPTNILGDARIDNGKLMRLTARMPAAAFRSGDVEARGLQAAIDLTTTGDRIAVRLDAAAESARLPGLRGETARAVITGDLPYPDLKGRKGDGRAALTAAFTAARFSSGETAARNADARLTFTGQTVGWIETFRIEGVGDLDVRAARIDGPAAASGARLRLDRARTIFSRDAHGLGWRLDGPAAVTAARASGAGLDGTGVTLSSARLVLGGRNAALEAEGPMAVSATRMVWGDPALNGVRGDGRLDLVVDGGLRLSATSSLSAPRASWPLFGPVGRDDPPELAGMKQALSAFAVDIPAFNVTAGPSGGRVVLTRSATLRPANGGVLTLSPVATPIFSAARGQAGGGALALTATRGQGLPEATFSIPAWRLTPAGFTATLDGRAALDFGLARGIAVQTRGELTSSNGRVTYVAAGCAPVTVERLELDESDVAELAGQICPAARPLASIADGGWRSDGTVRGFSADAPFLALRFRDIQGGFTAVGGPAGINLDARVASATVEDATTPLRFNPLGASGSARMTGEDWTGAFDLTRNEAALGRLILIHDGGAGVGGIAIDAPSIIFAEGGLQPGDLSPLAGEFVGSPATGSVSFAGRIDWRAEAEGTSSGRLTIPGLDFVSPAGTVKGLRGTIDFINLAPLTAAPGQRLTADLLESVAPLTDIGLTFGLDKAAVTIQGGELAVAGGRVSVEPFAVPLDPNQPITGVIVLDKVQLGEVIAGSGFGDKVVLDAVVSGRLPFTSTRENGVRITGGTLAAVQPGRLSIAREALSGLEAGGGGEDVPPNTIQDLAYQAMENLSFDLLSAEVNSLDEGRIGVLFRIRGRHDPPQRQELRISIAEFISREFLNRELPLPSDTGIDLTLDTTLNLNQLIGDLLELNRARNGQASPVPVPAPATP